MTLTLAELLERESLDGTLQLLTAVYIWQGKRNLDMSLLSKFYLNKKLAAC
jgi:hypothetical protein